MRDVYPVIFIETKDEKDTFLIEIPDWEILTEGYGLADSIDMARDAICTKALYMEDQGQSLPKPSSITGHFTPCEEFKKAGKMFVSPVVIDTKEYRRQHETKSVRRSVTLPAWLNREADAEKLNVSRILQEALKEKLQSIRA